MPYSIPSTTVQGIATDSNGYYISCTMATAGTGTANVTVKYHIV